MTTFDAIQIIEQEEQDEQDVLTAFQHLINTGVVWQLQGWYGRTAARLITQGICTQPEN